MNRRVVSTLLLAFVLVLATVFVGAAQSTTKSLSTNFTLVNLGTDIARGAIQYFKPDGSQWRVDENFELAANGGQAIYRQYFDNSLPDGRGSVVISADQSVGAVVQILARGQNPTSSGAYSGFSQGDSSFYVPLAARNRGTASGTANTQIAIQNTGSSDVAVEVDLVPSVGSGFGSFTKTGITIKPNATYLYDVALEAEANVPSGWIGSAVVRATTTGGQVAVVSNFFTGDAMQTFNAFGASAPGPQWFVPLFTSRLSNSLSTPITIQNLSGGQINANGITVECSGDQAPFSRSNPEAIPDGASFAINPVVDMTLPSGFTGSCIVNASADVVAFVQMRFIATGEAAAYEAFKGGATDKTVIVPLVAKRLANGFATAITIQNLNTGASATVDLTYTPSPEYVANGGSPSVVTIPDVVIDPGKNLIQNHRIESGTNSVPQLPNGWQGTLVVTSDQPVAGFAQLTFIRSINPSLPGGDNFMAHDAFTRP